LNSYKSYLQLACLNDQNKSGFFGGPAFIQPIRAIEKVLKKLWLVGKKPALQKSHFCFDHVTQAICVFQSRWGSTLFLLFWTWNWKATTCTCLPFKVGIHILLFNSVFEAEKLWTPISES